MDRLLLIDGHSVAYRAFFALPVENFSTTTGQSTNAVFGFTSMLINVLRDEKPTHVAVAFDVSRQTFRLEQYAEYKGNRSKSPPEFTGQIPLIKEILDALHIQTFEKVGFEADDIIGTLTTRAEAAGMEVLICTGDRDALQLVTEQTTVLYPRKGVSDLARMTPTAVEEKYAVTPEHYPDIAALVGETSDNLPGVPGVGPKTAAKWINQYGTLDALVADVDNIPGKAGESLREHLDDVLRNRRINALIRDLDLPAGPADLGFDTVWDREAIHTVFDALEFNALRVRLFEAFGEVEPQTEEGFDLDGVNVEPGAVAAWLDEHSAPGVRLGLHVQGSWGRGTGDVVASGHRLRRCRRVDQRRRDHRRGRCRDRCLARRSRSVPRCCTTSRVPPSRSAARGWTLEGVAADTALSAYVVRPDQRSYDLADLSVRYLKRELRDDSEPVGPADPRHRQRRCRVRACCAPAPRSTWRPCSTRRSSPSVARR